jgi:hypothetical protein
MPILFMLFLPTITLPRARHPTARAASQDCTVGTSARGNHGYTGPEVEIVDEFPMTVTGKIGKVEMREATAKKLGLG